MHLSKLGGCIIILIWAAGFAALTVSADNCTLRLMLPQQQPAHQPFIPSEPSKPCQLQYILHIYMPAPPHDSTKLFTFIYQTYRFSIDTSFPEDKNLLLAETFYRIGSVIFGGGQVVLPMLVGE